MLLPESQLAAFQHRGASQSYGCAPPGLRQVELEQRLCSGGGTWWAKLCRQKRHLLLAVTAVGFREAEAAEVSQAVGKVANFVMRFCEHLMLPNPIDYNSHL